MMIPAVKSHISFQFPWTEGLHVNLLKYVNAFPLWSYIEKAELNNPCGDNSVWLLLMQKQPDDALNEPSRGFYMHSWCLRVCTPFLLYVLGAC